MKQTGLIYIAVNSVTAQAYVGQTQRPLKIRKARHLHDARTGKTSDFCNALRNNGIDAFEWRVLENDVPDQQLKERERYWINYYDSFRNGYNMTTGGGGGFHSEESRAKIAEASRQHNARRLQNGTHHFLNPEFQAENRNRVLRELADGTHNFCDTALQEKRIASVKEAMAERVANGTHNLQDPAHHEKYREAYREGARKGNAQRLKDGTHHLLNPDVQRQCRRTRIRNEKNRQTEAGQQFLFEEILDEQTKEI